AGLTPVPSSDLKPPRVAEAAIAMEVKVTQIVPVEGTPNTLILGQVIRFHFRNGLLRPDRTVDAAKLKPVARLSGDEYASFGAVFHLPRPVD
ncbi:MAG: flavin reductase family protein, partial [bacterium]